MSTYKNLIYPQYLQNFDTKIGNTSQRKELLDFVHDKVMFLNLLNILQTIMLSFQGNKSTCPRTLTNEQGTSVLPCEITDPTVKTADSLLFGQ